MKELINFIPRTVAECRLLLVTLRDSTEGVTLTDRYGQTHTLNIEECRKMASIIEKQIGEKTPDAPAKETPKAKKTDTKNKAKK